jgi:hypothetical protein
MTDDPIQSFIADCDSFCAKHGISRGRLSTILLSGGDRLDKIASKKSSPTYKTLAAARERLVQLDAERFAMAKRETAA